MIEANVKLDLTKLDNLKRSIRSKILRKAIRVASKGLQQQVKSSAPRLTGALKQSIGTKVVNYNQALVGIIGPKTKYEKKKGGEIKKPFKYAGLVERHRPFLQPSFNAATVQSIMATEIENGIKEVLG